MRKYLSVLCILSIVSSLNVAAQCSIVVNVHTSGFNYEYYFVQATLFDEGTFEQQISFKKKPFRKIRRLKPGKYQIIYKNKFGEFSRAQFTLKKGQRKYPVDLHYNKLDSVKYLGKGRIDSLENGDSLRVSFESFGCFHHFKRNIVYYQKGDQLYGTNQVDTVLIDSTHKQKIRMFETEMEYPHMGNCTTFSFYRVYLNGDEVAGALDGSCSWNGFYRYLAAIFPRNEED